MIKTSDKYKQKIINTKTNNNGVTMNTNVKKFIDESETIKIKQIPRLNHKQRRELEKIMVRKFKSNELIEFNKISRKELNSRIRESLKQFACNNEAGEYRMYIDLTDISIKDCFKNFDNPNVEILSKDDNFYFIRPKEQTKAERQTEVYQLEQLLDILKGSKKPEVTFVVKTDKDYKGRKKFARLAKDCGVKRYIFNSTCAVYGYNKNIVYESSIKNPLSTYAKANLRAESEIFKMRNKKFKVSKRTS